jgi:hypothetical protein
MNGRRAPQQFFSFARLELNGYPNSTELPGYRGPFQGELKANLVGVQGL